MCVCVLHLKVQFIFAKNVRGGVGGGGGVHVSNYKAFCLDSLHALKRIHPAVTLCG